jgi:hypothetical protein
MEDTMTFDLLSAIALTASAAIAITVVALAVAGTPDRRIRLAAALATWFVVVVALGASRAFSYDGALGVPGMGLAVMLPILVMTTLTFATAGGRRALENAPVPALIGLNVVRIAGVSFLLLHAAGRLPAPFAPVAGWGDIAVGAAAPLVAWMVLRDHPWSRRAALTWNALGLLDLVAAVSLGVTSSPGPLRIFVADPSSAIMSELPWLLIPGFLVPLLASSHVVVFARLAGSPRSHHRALVA